MVRPFTHDLYASLSHHEAMGPGDGQTLPSGFGSSTYLPYDDARRLTAYRIMAAMRDNVARYYLPEAMWQTGRVTGGTEAERVTQFLAALDSVAPAEKRREYGDPALLVSQGRSLMLGDSQDLVIPELVELLNQAKDKPDAGDTETPATEQARLEQWHQWLTDWADQERLGLALLEGEESTVGDGDGIYALGWSERLGRPRLRVYDPGWYFPDLSTIGDDEEHPTVKHIAWEETRGEQVFLHRKTWKVIPADPYAVPWSDTKADRTCTYEVGEWDITKIGQREDIYTLGKPTNVIKPLVDLRIDFLPVVHVPNDAAGKRHFGRSLILLVAQLLDDLASTDTDLAANSELVGSTPLVTKGAGTPALGAGPGAQWNLPAGADAKLLDTSRALDGLIKLDQHLLDRLSVNTRLAAALLGRVKPNEVPSGFALELGFAPTRSLIREMRMVRAAKHPLLLKFAMRIAQANGAKVPKGETPRAEIALGGFLPADKAAAVEQVTKLLKDHAISRPTAVQILIQADFPIDDAELEVERIAKEAFEDMVKLVEATGDEAEARRRLGIAALPTPTVPPPGDNAGGGGADGA